MSELIGIRLGGVIVGASAQSGKLAVQILAESYQTLKMVHAASLLDAQNIKGEGIDKQCL